MVAGSRPLAAPDNLMDGAPEERNSSRRRWRRRGVEEDSAREEGEITEKQNKKEQE